MTEKKNVQTIINFRLFRMGKTAVKRLSTTFSLLVNKKAVGFLFMHIAIDRLIGSDN